MSVDSELARSRRGDCHCGIKMCMTYHSLPEPLHTWKQVSLFQPSMNVSLNLRLEGGLNGL